jgi:hypothetical protein
MTAPAKSTPAKSTNAPKTTPDVVAPDTESKPVSRIPEVIANNNILRDFCQRYLDVYDEITEYNKAVLAERDSEWNAGKVLEKARELSRPTDKTKTANETVKAALENFESLVNELARARKNVLDITSKELGISLSAVADRDPAVEAPLKEKRKLAIEIANQLGMIAKITNDENASAAVTEFLSKVGMPAIGRDQVRSFTADGAGSTPKYRVSITVSKDDTVLLSEDGFTKTALALTKPTFGYERGKAPKSDVLRAAWEKAGNTPEKTVVSPVEFDDNGLHYVITKK